jgi:ABC-2 type transport system permease protein
VILTIDPSRQTLAPALQALLDHLLGGISASVTGQAPWLEVQTESVQAREVRTIDYLLPGILAMSIMQLGLFATAQPLVALRVQGVLKRLGATPLRRPALLVAYIALRLSVALFQTAIIVVIGRYLFQVAMIGSWWQFAGWIFLGAVAFLSIGFFMAAVSRNEESCIAIGNIINLPMILLSGVFFPLGSLPRFLHVAVNLVPLNYLADALRQTMVDAVPLHDAQTNAIALGAWTLVMGVLAVRFFRWE